MKIKRKLNENRIILCCRETMLHKEFLTMPLDRTQLLMVAYFCKEYKSCMTWPS